jgi:hypothetical protein
MHNKNKRNILMLDLNYNGTLEGVDSTINTKTS